MATKKFTIGEIKEAINDVAREIAGLDAQITEVRRIIFSLGQEGQRYGSLASYREQLEIDTDEEVARNLLRRLKMHRSESVSHRSKLEEQLMDIEAKYRRAQREAAREQRARKARVQG